MISGYVRSGREGRMFGWIESASRFSVVLGGLVAGLAASWLGVQSLFPVGALALVASCALMTAGRRAS
jgi:hypothetical protein